MNPDSYQDILLVEWTGTLPFLVGLLVVLAAAAGGMRAAQPSSTTMSSTGSTCK